MNGPWELSLQAALRLPSPAMDCTILLSSLGGDGGLSGSQCHGAGGSQHSCPPEQLPHSSQHSCPPGILV